LVTYPVVIQHVRREQVVFGYEPISDPACAQTEGRIGYLPMSDPACAQTAGRIWLRTH
jgi:hypothetical protein